LPRVGGALPARYPQYRGRAASMSKRAEAWRRQSPCRRRFATARSHSDDGGSLPVEAGSHDVDTIAYPRQPHGLTEPKKTKCL
jgi:hypothetical protein